MDTNSTSVPAPHGANSPRGASTPAGEDAAAACEPHTSASITAASQASMEGIGADGGIGLKLETENLIDTYHVVAEWIRFADTKAAVVLTVGAAMASYLVPTLREFLHADRAGHPFPWWPRLVCGLFAGWLLFFAMAVVYAFRCVTPFRRQGRHPALERCTHFHPAAIANTYSMDEHERFVDGYEQASRGGFQREVLAGLLIDSHISAAKYGFVTRSIKLLALSALLGLLYLLSIQF